MGQNCARNTFGCVHSAAAVAGTLMRTTAQLLQLAQVNVRSNAQTVDAIEED
jgi:hypothetical protein